MSLIKNWLSGENPKLYSYLRYLYWFLRGRTSTRSAEKRLLQVSDNPKSFNQKILYKMAHDRNPILTIFADKLAVREFVQARVGLEYLCEIYAHFDIPEDLLTLNLPNEFVIKPNHGSGACVLVWDKILRSSKIDLGLGNNWRGYLVSPSDFSPISLIPLLTKWLRQNYYTDIGRLPEWAYKDIKPSILIEELLIDSFGNIPRDYKFFMFDGKCEMIQVDNNRFNQHTRNLYSPEWELLPVTLRHPSSSALDPRPLHLAEMLHVAESLSIGVDFVRVDLYETLKGVKFGELTNYPGSGKEIFTPRTWDLQLGSQWKPNYLSK